jgi:hypothetical protein
MEIVYVPLAQARRCNRGQVDEWLATYTRLFAELAAFGRRLSGIGTAFSPTVPSPEHLRKRLEKHFAPSLDGFQSVVELREGKLALESELAAAKTKLKDTIEHTHRRFRGLREDIAQAASAKAGLLQFVEQACLGELSEEQQRGLRKAVGTELQSFKLPDVQPSSRQQGKRRSYSTRPRKRSDKRAWP